MGRRLLSIDPGKRNCWWVLFKIGLTGNLRPLMTQQLDMLPEGLVLDRCEHYFGSVKQLLTLTKPDHIVAERFVTRPRGGRGNVSEPVNLFLGMLYYEARRRRIDIRYVMPSTHKVWRRKIYGDDDAFFETCPTDYVAHQLDACSIGIYGWQELIRKGDDHYYEPSCDFLRTRP